MKREIEIYDFEIKEANEMFTWATLKCRLIADGKTVYEGETSNQYGFGALVEDPEEDLECLNEETHMETDEFIDFIAKTICRKWDGYFWEPVKDENELFDSLFEEFKMFWD